MRQLAPGVFIRPSKYSETFQTKPDFAWCPIKQKARFTRKVSASTLVMGFSKNLGLHVPFGVGPGPNSNFRPIKEHGTNGDLGSNSPPPINIF